MVSLEFRSDYLKEVVKKKAFRNWKNIIYFAHVGFQLDFSFIENGMGNGRGHGLSVNPS